MTAAQYPIQTPQQLAPLLRALRKKQGLTQADLADQLGITRQAVTALEARPEAATFERLMKVWAVLGLQVSLAPRAPSSSSLDAVEW